MNDTLDVLNTLTRSPRGGTCVSIYLNQADPRLPGTVPSIGLYREITRARRLLESTRSRHEAGKFVQPLLLAARDELLEGGPGTLALFHSDGVTSCVRLPEPVTARTVVSDSFHVKPLVQLSQDPDEERLEREMLECSRARAAGNTTTELFGIAQALRLGTVHRLWVAEDVAVWGRVNHRHATVVLEPEQRGDRVEDVLDDLCEWALEQGAEVRVLPASRLPCLGYAIAELHPLSVKSMKGVPHEAVRKRA